MTWGVTQEAASDTAAATPTTYTVALGAATTGGSVIIVVGSDATVSTPAGFVVDASQVFNDGHYVFRKASSTGETSWVLTPSTGASGCWWVGEVAGLVAGLDQQSGAGTSSSVASLSTGTTAATTSPDEFCIASWVSSDPTNPAVTWSAETNGFVERIADRQTTKASGTNVGLAVASLVLAATQTVESTATSSLNTPSTAIVVTYAVQASTPAAPSQNYAPPRFSGPISGPTGPSFWVPPPVVQSSFADVRADTAVAELGIAPAVSAVKVARVTTVFGAVSVFGASSTAVVRKVATPSVTASAGLSAVGSARKVAPAAAVAVVGLTSNAVRVAAHAVTAVASAGLAAAAGVVKRATPAASANLGGVVSVAARKVGRPALSAAAGLSASAAAKKLGVATAASVVGLSAVGSARKLAVAGVSASVGFTSWAIKASANSHAITAVAELGLAAQVAVVKRATPLANSALGLTVRAGAATKHAISGRVSLGAAAQAAGAKRQGVVARVFAGLASSLTYNRVPLGGTLNVVARPVPTVAEANRATPTLATGNRTVTSVGEGARGATSLTQSDRPVTTLKEGPP